MEILPVKVIAKAPKYLEDATIVAYTDMIVETEIPVDEGSRKPANCYFTIPPEVSEFFSMLSVVNDGD